MTKTEAPRTVTIPFGLLFVLFFVAMLSIGGIAVAVAVGISGGDRDEALSLSDCRSEVRDRNELRSVLLDLRVQVASTDGRAFVDGLLEGRPEKMCVQGDDGLYRAVPKPD